MHSILRVSIKYTFLVEGFLAQMEQGLEEGMHRMLKRPGIEVESIDESIVE